ncbi:peroxide stress protein YaaA [Kushneria sp. TE3]|uniref:peroxide stress protein YaaA n=1 Tax=Kushneria sp. TE3 TaxID=3449832 RepID=UPI003F6878CB
MLSVLSPAKTLDFETPSSTTMATQPDYLDQSRQLIDILREYSPQDLSQLMGISDKLAGLNVARFEQWQTPFDTNNAKQAILAFQGDVYTGLEAARWQENDLEWAQSHLRILSGLYGMLRPLDLMQPYRLEMGTRLENPAGRDLYAFWRERLTRDLDQAVKESSGDPVLINLASNEYFGAIDRKHLGCDVITPVFKDAKNGQYKVISFYAKKARGMMSAWMVQQRLEKRDDLKAFDMGGYRFNADLSDQNSWVFTRDAQ